MDRVGRVGRRVDRSVIGGHLSSGSRWGRKPKQLEHMAACQQPKDLGLFSLTPSPTDLFIYLHFLCLQRAEDQLALNENRDDLNEKKKGNKTGPRMVVHFLFLLQTLDVSTKHLNLSGSRTSSVILWILSLRTNQYICFQWKEDDIFFTFPFSLFQI